jgi:imidazolonepropionase-like amidohydrolase
MVATTASNDPGLTAFVNVAVVPMDREGVMNERTVLVESTRISEIGDAAETAIPEGASVIDGTGMYLMPGLCDMHVHLVFRDVDPAHLVLYLAEGVTTVRSLSGDARNIGWRDRVAAGELVGPTILTSGPTMTGPIDVELPAGLPALPVIEIETVDDAVAEVQRQAASGVDLIKVYDGLDPEVYLAAVREARRSGVYVSGHVLDALSLEDIVAAGLNEIAHVDELNFRHWLGEPGDPGFTFDRAAIPATADLLARHDVAVVSNLSADEVMIDLIGDTVAVLERPEYRVVPPQMLEFWRTRGRQLERFSAQGPYRKDLEFPFFQSLIEEFDRIGVTVLTGTDTSFLMEGTVPANIHREIELLVEAGLTPFAALSAGTSQAATVVARMGRDHRFGTVSPGNRADMVLLEGNPLDDVAETRRRVGVMTRGRYRTQDELDLMVDDIVAGYATRVTA